MAFPWLRIIDGVLGATDMVRRVRGSAVDSVSTGSRGIEARLAGVVVSALKEVFDRDHERFAVERERIEDERRRAERAMRLELLRQAGEREIARQRLIAVFSGVSLLGTFLLVTHMLASGAGARVCLGLGWLLLIAGLAAASLAQSVVGRALGRADEGTYTTEVTSSLSGLLSPWLVVAGLAFVGLGMLLT